MASEANSDVTKTNAETAVWTIGRLLNWTSSYFEQKKIEDARLAAEVLLAHAIGCRRIDIYARFEDAVDAAHLDRLRGWVKRASNREPIAYLVEEKEFFSLPFHVTPDVLIPRSETEVLVECAIDYCSSAGLSEPKLFDLGTGSGCVAVAIAKHVPTGRVVASDISRAALDLAHENAKRHLVADRIHFVEADGLALGDGAIPAGGFDVLVSNPPYVAADDLTKLDATVRKFEPHIALSDGNDGLSFYRMIGEESAKLLAEDGVVFVEIEDGKETAVIDSVQAAGQLVHQRTWKDRVVGKERVLLFTRGNGK